MEGKIGVSSLESTLAQLKVDYDAAGGSSQEYIEILEDLNKLKVPSSIVIDENLSSQLAISKQNINLNHLKALGAW